MMKTSLRLRGRWQSFGSGSSHSRSHPSLAAFFFQRNKRGASVTVSVHFHASHRTPPRYLHHRLWLLAHLHHEEEFPMYPTRSKVASLLDFWFPRRPHQTVKMLVFLVSASLRSTGEVGSPTPGVLRL